MIIVGLGGREMVFDNIKKFEESLPGWGKWVFSLVQVLVIVIPICFIGSMIAIAFLAPDMSSHRPHGSMEPY